MGKVERPLALGRREVEAKTGGKYLWEHPEPIPDPAKVGERRGSQGKRGYTPQLFLGNVRRLGQAGAQPRLRGMQLGRRRRRRRLRNVCTSQARGGFPQLWLGAGQGCPAPPGLMDGGPWLAGMLCLLLGDRGCSARVGEAAPRWG